MPGESKTRTSATPRIDDFADRHIGPRPDDVETMLSLLGLSSLEELVERTIPESIRAGEALRLEPPRSETGVLSELRELADRNESLRSYIGMGYAGCLTPPVIQRAILENPGWYTAYTPYQPEISQGRLEALLNFQTMIADLTGLPVANASLLDEGTAAAEAMTLCRRVRRRGDAGEVFFVSERCHPVTIAVVRTRAEPLGIRVVVGDHERAELGAEVFGALLQYPATDGTILDYGDFCARAHAAGTLVVVATDLLASTLLRPPGEFGADVAVGNSQRFGVPLGYGGPHAAFLATRDEYKRQLPGRLIGVARDADGGPALRMALQTREQHIRRDKATSNICTAQVLLAVIASMYAVYHGPERLRALAARIRRYTTALVAALRDAGLETSDGPYFDTIKVIVDPGVHHAIVERALAAGINLRRYGDGQLGLTLDETVGTKDLEDLCEIFGADFGVVEQRLRDREDEDYPAPHGRQSDYLTHPVFHRYHSETEFLRYAHRLQVKDLALDTSMIPLGSCTMKLNAAAQMYPISFPGFASLHPFVPRDQAVGYRQMIDRLGSWLLEITGFAGISMMPNSGAQGEYAGLLVIRAYHASRGDERRDVCLIPESAHGTNPASAIMAGMRVVVVACDARGNVDLEDLREKAASHRERLAALMLTYPSTHGVFEESVRDICGVVHEHGGQVYLDGANLNAMVGLCRPADFGADVCHLNLHKTFCIPHGGGGPGMGPIVVAAHLVPFLPHHPMDSVGGAHGVGPVASAPFGSPSILPISYAYIAMMGGEGLARATRIAILNANYVAKRLEGHFDLLYRGEHGLVAHECIIDPRPLRDTAEVGAEDIAKRLMDYGFHAPTMSWPVAGTLMVEPTESESKAELDRFCDALISIREEIREIERGEQPKGNNLLTNAPHTAAAVSREDWDRPYSRERAVFPAPWVRESKFWPAVARVDNAYGDRHLVCSCPPVEAFAEPAAPGQER